MESEVKIKFGIFTDELQLHSGWLAQKQIITHPGFHSSWLRSTDWAHQLAQHMWYRIKQEKIVACIKWPECCCVFLKSAASLPDLKLSTFNFHNKWCRWKAHQLEILAMSWNFSYSFLSWIAWLADENLKKNIWINPASTENYKQDGYIVLSENGKIVSDITTNG